MYANFMGIFLYRAAEQNRNLYARFFTQHSRAYIFIREKQLYIISINYFISIRTMMQKFSFQF